MIPKTQSLRESWELDFTKIQAVVFSEESVEKLRHLEGMAQTWRKYLHIMYLM